MVVIVTPPWMAWRTQGHAAHLQVRRATSAGITTVWPVVMPPVLAHYRLDVHCFPPLYLPTHFLLQRLVPSLLRWLLNSVVVYSFPYSCLAPPPHRDGLQRPAYWPDSASGRRPSVPDTDRGTLSTGLTGSRMSLTRVLGARSGCGWEEGRMGGVPCNVRMWEGVISPQMKRSSSHPTAGVS